MIDLDPETTIYHYTSLEAALEHILPTRWLRMSRVSGLNDPKDAKDRNIVLMSRLGPLNADRAIALQTRYRELSGHLSRVLCFTLDSIEEHDPQWSASVEGRGFALPAMWSHYGSRRRGVCLAFDRGALASAAILALPADTEVYVDRVQYESVDRGWCKSRSIDTDFADDMDSAMIAHLVKYRRQLFFSKARDWSYERELRFLAISSAHEDTNVDINESLRCVFIGDEFPVVYEYSLRRALRGLPVPVCRLGWDGGVPSPVLLD